MGGVNHIPKPLTNGADNGFRERLPILIVLTARGYAQGCFPCHGVRGYGGVCLRVYQITKPIFHGGFPHAVNPEDTGIELTVGFAQEIGHNRVIKHGDHFLWGARQQNNRFALLFKDAARRCAICIGQDGGFLWEHGLLAVICSHNPMHMRETLFHSLIAALVQDEIPITHHVRGRLFCQVVLGRP
ncbi:hypothetical protein SDC9_179875 [bioreactor metagenome]|uniref:Uncharacterized protein n=1 Tax=bioreactor metagenome TaxID=1076179 RepID=A0A645H028_9ZZZZ